MSTRSHRDSTRALTSLFCSLASASGRLHGKREVQSLQREARSLELDLSLLFPQRRRRERRGCVYRTQPVLTPSGYLMVPSGVLGKVAEDQNRETGSPSLL